MGQPVVRNYSAGSIIYFMGDIGDEIYVLQKGRVILLSTSLDHKEDIKEDVRRGEFFGVKSAVGHYPREETAQVLTDSQVLVFKVADFEQFSLKNPRIVLQMLKVFSSQLRKVHKKVRELLGEGGSRENAVELLTVAECYYRMNKIDYAVYGFEAFLRHYPRHALAERARKMLQSAKTGSSFPIDALPLEEELSRRTESSASGGFSGTTAPSTQDFAAPDLGSFDSGGMDDFAAPPLDDAGLDAGFGEPASDNMSPSQQYYTALNLFSQGNLQGAIDLFEKVIQTKTFANASEAQFLEKAMFDQARAYQKMGRGDTAVEKFSLFMKKFPRSALLKKAWLHIGEVYEAKKDIPRAVSCYDRAAKIPPDDKDSVTARNKIKTLTGK